MTTNDWLGAATRQLDSAGIGTARLDALVLLEDATKKDRSYLLAHPETSLQDPILQRLNKHVKRRMKHEPLAFIREKTEFYGREFFINHTVLEPRPESEAMIELLKELSKIAPWSKVRSWKVVDVGTGSGALAVTAKLEMPEVEVVGIDIDPKCLVVALQNAERHNINVKFLQGNLLEPLNPDHYPLTAILANLPYVPDDYTINQAAAMEPRQAIFGGPDGLYVYRQLFDQIKRVKLRVQLVFTEALPMQHKALAGIAKRAGFELEKSEDFIQVFTKS